MTQPAPFEKVIFQPVFESLSRALGHTLDPTLRARFKAELGVDFGKLYPAYPLDTWVRAVHLSMTTLFPAERPPEAQRLMGRRIVDAYLETAIGRALFTMLKILGPKRALRRLTHNLRTSNNYSETSMRELQERSWEVWINQVDLPWFDAGVLEAGLTGAGARGCLVAVQAHDERGTTYLVGWS